MIDVEELSQAVVLGILQNSNSVPFGAEIWSSPQEFKKLKTIIEYAVAYSNKQKELTQYDRGFDDGCKHTKKIYEAEIEALKIKNQALKIMNDGNNKIIEEYEHKYPDFFFMEHDIQGER